MNDRRPQNFLPLMAAGIRLGLALMGMFCLPATAWARTDISRAWRSGSA